MQRAVKIRHYLAVMESFSFSAASVLEGSGIVAAQLADPKFAVEVRQCKQVVANMMRLSGNQGIGFEVGSRIRMADLGIFAHAIMSSRTLWHAIDLWARYGTTLAGMLISTELAEDDENNWSFAINEVSPLGFLYNFCVEEALAMFLKLGIAVVGKQPTIRGISLSYHAPSHEADYRRYFDCPIEFNAERTCVVFNAPALHQPLQSNDDELNEVCQLRCQQIQRQIENQGSASVRLRELLLKKSAPLLSLGEAAAAMGMGMRNLRRQLELEGTTYRHIVNELRIELAKEYLSQGEFQPKEISYLLGFKDATAFRRAFKSWTGKTVGGYKAGSK